MVGPGEVDDDLEPETAEECSKYGKVVRCVIFEVMTGTWSKLVGVNMFGYYFIVARFDILNMYALLHIHVFIWK